VHNSIVAKRRGHLDALDHVVQQAPLVVAALPAIVALCLSSMRGEREGETFFSWSSPLPETLLALTVTAIYFVNPTPYRYNLVPLSAFVFVAGARLLPELRELAGSRALRAALVGVLIGCHLLPFGMSTWRLREVKNDRQRELIALSERMTDPEKDYVYDGSGLVVMRNSIGRFWLLHTLTLANFYDGTFPSIVSMLETHTPSVFIPSYRTDWLRAPERRFVYEHYVPLADDIFVLGQVLPAGEANFDCLHAGRYHVARDNRSVMLDGEPLTQDVVYLKEGTHHFVGDEKRPTFVRWLGPKLKSPPRLKSISHYKLLDGGF
jgi:hypothetical protein